MIKDFFSSEVGNTITWFGSTHIFLLLGLILTLVVLWVFGPKMGKSKHERLIRIILIGLVFVFEWRVFENRVLNGSIFRIPLCGIALYGLTYAVAFKNEKVFKIMYFYAFGTLLTFLLFDTVWGLDSWNGWTYFGAHATIAWLAVYGYRTLGFTPTKKDLHLSIVFLAIYAFISGYATYRYGGSDELFLLSAPAEMFNALIDVHILFYLALYLPFAALCLYAMYLPIYLQEKRVLKRLTVELNKVNPATELEPVIIK
ncbi:TMEM164 family acyltransferase [Liberiplasma polymorphum]|uniref:TMEM164 family acyltransferase n=1 Tax=Liberiplasma polymorphum TaxID=3374570 RepID=UPI003775180F